MHESRLAVASARAFDDEYVARVHFGAVGAEQFAEELKQLDVSVIHVDWRPPAGGNKKLADLLAKLGS